ncbi:MAG: hypothetical protein UU54_C0005G0006 [Candidatus Yanofskybacteria bacterium GW2011_GWA2_41_22]|uniref:Uncharacterized protein n=3 Tax=Parcubacteria group TaxID=1794811 RepID=A0A0G0YM61_9BACT|nr:MAG: hypothetical protein UU54_C0005G0006 [Candidatus Yanofskybacteria bacterium GW2011_GWA2_41_22]KKS24438.1 MAG: hypothetical protein UU83_C0025G0004 [Candidatus Jorgensenbacteria bacterium GW2011_GWF2_41_8]KKS26303.1 MAG: hypothetical protein UU84_C0027G0003 [Candidatus Yanofskybacteria bacterium GW2011_GWC2_41_9]OGN10086.1 MAG: hypothetical protein A3C64_02700 [Candidatus Yanofskybacteria bacterium RIFCSPHIGHO2_02_FULL_41_12]
MKTTDSFVLSNLYCKASSNPEFQLVRLENGNVVIGLVLTREEEKPVIFIHNRFYSMVLFELRLGNDKEEILTKIDNLRQLLSSQEPLAPEEYILNEPPEWSL